jgi:16S rRNA (cytidine1402-2'-O)-methyltransferase
MLYLVATPIGNLGDMTLRALETLKTVDLIASEDTRKTGQLLKHYEIKKPLISFHDHNEQQRISQLVTYLQQGQSIAVVSDAGTPGISDPGFRLVRRMIQEDLAFTMIPGATAFVMALVLSGLPVHSFTFRGFPPRKPGPRQRFLRVDQRSPHTLIYYESPYRLQAFLQDALQIFGDRPAAVGNDLTKRFEHVWKGTLSELGEEMQTQKLRGEYTVVIGGVDIQNPKGTECELGQADGDHSESEIDDDFPLDERE